MNVWKMRNEIVANQITHQNPIVDDRFQIVRKFQFVLEEACGRQGVSRRAELRLCSPVWIEIPNRCNHEANTIEVSAN